MRKLKLQMQTTIDGYVAGPNGELDWMTQKVDDKIMQYIYNLADTSDTLLLGRKMTAGFMEYWENVVKNHPESDEFPLAQRMVNIPKIVFTKTLEKSNWTNTVLAKGNLADEVNKLKKMDGKDIIVYGGAGFVSSLIGEGLIDEFHFFVDPAIIGAGMKIFNSNYKKQKLVPDKSTAYDCGITVLSYKLDHNRK